MHYSINAIDNNGVLYPDVNGNIPITIDVVVDNEGNKSASISFHGAVQGYAIYDSTGTTIVGISVAALGYEDSAELTMSLNNIAAVI